VRHGKPYQPKMPQSPEDPILNSPFCPPSRHWALDDSGAFTSLPGMPRSRRGIGNGDECLWNAPSCLLEGTDMPADAKTLIEKIAALPAERIAEIEDFVDFIRSREQERSLTRAAAAASAPAFAAIWSNPDDDVYDAL
jgi:hypothetical protein